MECLESPGKTFRDVVEQMLVERFRERSHMVAYSRQEWDRVFRPVPQALRSLFVLIAFNSIIQNCAWARSREVGTCRRRNIPKSPGMASSSAQRCQIRTPPAAKVVSRNEEQRNGIRFHPIEEYPGLFVR